MRKQNISFLRGAACLMVFIVHFGQRMHYQGLLGLLTEQGQFGVYLLFIISGYLIASACESYAREHPWRYIRNRMLRLLPLYYGVILYYFLVHTFWFRDMPADPAGVGWLRYLFFLNGILPGTGLYHWDNMGLTWTIPFFVWAYITIPILLRWVKTFRSSLLVWAVSLLGNILFHEGSVWFSILWEMTYFLGGVLVFYCIREKKQKVLVPVLVLLILYEVATGIRAVMFYSHVFMLLVMATDGWHFTNPVFVKALEISDRYSYTMYLAHGILFIHVLDRHSLGAFRPLAAVAGTVVLTAAAYWCFERPVDRLLKKALGKLPKQPQSRV